MNIKEKLNLLHDNPVVAWHEHIWAENTQFKDIRDWYANNTIEVFDKFGIDKIVSSVPVVHIKRCLPETFRAANDITYKAMQRYPGRVYGLCYVHPGYLKEALAEIDRCVKDLGMVGLKLYYDYTMDDPVWHPIIEKCIELDIPMLMHSMHCMDAPNHIRQPLATDGVHMARAAKKYPEATFLMGHFTVAEWEWSLKAIADCPNVYTDMSGSQYESPQIEEAVRLLGADRIVFGTDGGWSSCVGKILGAKISDEDKKTILAGHAFRRFLERGDKQLCL